MMTVAEVDRIADALVEEMERRMGGKLSIPARIAIRLITSNLLADGKILPGPNL